MDRTAHIFVLFMLAISVSGCASSGYFTDRGRDAADIFTATFGPGMGVKAQAGPINLGLGYRTDLCGLKGGMIGNFDEYSDCMWDLCEINAVLFSGQTFAPVKNEVLKERHKCYNAAGVLGLAVPFPIEEESWSRGHLYRLTAIEVSVGVVYNVQIGFNPGELLDFILGWTTLDMYDDDMGRKTNRQTVDEQQEQLTQPSSPSSN